jgi:hypothetical protein
MNDPAQEAHELLGKVLELCQEDQRNALKEGIYLFEMHKLRSWLNLGYDSEIAMFSDSNLDIRTSQRKRRATIWYREWGLDPKKYIEVGHTKLAYLAGHATKETHREVLETYGHMSMKGLQRALGAVRDKAPEGFRRVICPKCGYHFEYKVPLHKPRKGVKANARLRRGRQDD